MLTVEARARGVHFTGYKSREEAIVNVVQTLTNLLTLWPREAASGFMVHFTHRCSYSSF